MRVTHFFAEDKQTYAVSESKAYCVDYAITELERKLDPKKFTVVKLKGGHHFDGDYANLARQILAAANP